MKKKKIPMRKCILSNEMRPKNDMIRVVINKEGDFCGCYRQEAWARCLRF